MKNLLTKALLAVAGVALVASSASAATTTYNAGDIFLGFRQTGNSQDYLIDLGPATQFNSSFQLTLSLSDLTGIFGTDWNSTGDSTVRWGLIGTAGSASAGALGYAKYTLWASRPELSVGTQSTAWNIFPQSTSQTGSGYITTMASNYVNRTASSSSMSAGIQALTETGVTANTSSYYDRAAGAFSGGANISFGVFNPTIEGTFANGTAGTVLDFYRLNTVNSGATAGTPSTLLGQMSIDNNGTLTFQAVPEPSSFVMMGIGAGALFLVLRRQRRSVAA